MTLVVGVVMFGPGLVLVGYAVYAGEIYEPDWLAAYWGGLFGGLIVERLGDKIRTW